MFTQDTHIYASLRIPTHITHVMHDYSDLHMLRNEYAQWLRNDYAIITHLVLSFAHCYAFIHMLRNVTHDYACLLTLPKFTHVNTILHMLSMLYMITLIYTCYAMNTQWLRNNYAMITQFLRV